jgi:serine/threonine protein kinase/tetratricopeptide (TPR) repeat protein
MDLIGRTIGKYTIVSRLGIGGMGVVYKGHRADLNHYAAIKVLPEHLADSPDFQQRFEREAQAIAQLNHPNILPIIDFGHEPDGPAYFIAKLATRGSLATRLSPGRPLPMPEVLYFVEKIAGALDHAHDRNMLHRDIKPSNVLLDDADWVLLADFGMVKIMSGTALTISDSLMGTPAYMAPEQCRGETLDRRADVYALGVAAFEMATGRLPFIAEMPTTVILKQINEVPPAPQHINAAIPDMAAYVILKALAKRPADRFATAGEFALALAQAIGMPSAIARTTRPIVEEEPAPPPITPPAPDLPPLDNIDSHITKDFVGREAELAYYLDRLTTQHLAIITGMPGIGKTTLALQLAQRFAGSSSTFAHAFHEGEGAEVIVWELAKFLAWHEQQDLWGMLRGAQQTGSKPPPIEVLFDHVLHLLRGRRYLLILDNFQYIEHDPLMDKLLERLRALLASGEVSVIIASQRKPAFASTSDYAVLTGLGSADAIRLLAQRGISLSPEVTDQLYRLTEGNPQLLTLAVGALHGAEDPERLVRHVAESENIEHYLMTAIDQRLNEEERAIMSAVSVFQGYAATRDAIEAALEDSTRIAGSIKRLLSDLRSRYLLLESDSAAGKAYAQHETVRGFYYALLNRRERLALHRRAASYFDTEAPDALQAARHFDLALEHERAAQLATADVWGAINRGQAQNLRALLDQLMGRSLSPIALAAVHVTRGQTCAFLGDRAIAQESFHTALAKLEAVPSDKTVKVWQARAHLGLADVVQDEALPEAVTWLQRGLKTVAGLNVLEEAIMHIQLGSVQVGMANYAEAQRETEEGLRLLPPNEALTSATLTSDALTSDAHWRAVGLMDLGIVYWKRGEVQRGTEFYQQALKIYDQAQDLWGMIPVQLDLGIEFDRAGQWPEAVKMYQAALDQANRLGAARFQMMLELAFGIINTKQGLDDLAQAHLLRCIELARTRTFNEALLAGLSSLADLHIRRQEWDTAEQALNEAEPLALSMDAKYQLTEVWRSRASIALARGQIDQAHETIEKTIDLCRDLELKTDEGMCWRVLGQVFAASDRLDQANDAFARSLGLVQDDGYEVARTQLEWGRALLDTNHDRATSLLHEARNTFERLGAQRDVTASSPV